MAEQDFTPRVTPDLVRDPLPGDARNVADDEIEDYISYHLRRVLRRTGSPTSDEMRAEVEHLVYMAARADTLERSMGESGVAEIPRVDNWREMVKEALDDLDANTAGGGEVGGKAARAAGSANLEPGMIGLWAPSDTGLPDPWDAPFAGQRGLWGVSP